MIIKYLNGPLPVPLTLIELGEITVIKTGTTKTFMAFFLHDAREAYLVLCIEAFRMPEGQHGTEVVKNANIWLIFSMKTS